jgi:two-component system sensor histidine kinase TctE
VPEAEREKVLTPFYRVAATLEANPVGTGLGLAIVHEIAALHKARLMLDSSERFGGLKVSVAFPAIQHVPSELSLEK